MKIPRKTTIFILYWKNYVKSGCVIMGFHRTSYIILQTSLYLLFPEFHVFHELFFDHHLADVSSGRPRPISSSSSTSSSSSWSEASVDDRFRDESDDRRDGDDEEDAEDERQPITRIGTTTTATATTTTTT